MAWVQWWQQAWTAFRLRRTASRLQLPEAALRSALGDVHPQLDDAPVTLALRNLGGKNNSGMVLHVGASGGPLAVSKLMDRTMAQREYRLLLM